MVLVNEYGERFIPVDRRCKVTKARTGETFEGKTQDDGLRSLFAVELEDGIIKYASVLDTIEWLS